MSRTVYSTRFIAVTAYQGTTLYTVPSDKKAVIRDISGYMAAPILAAGTYYVGIWAVAALDWWVVDVDTTIQHHWEGRQVVNPGEQIYFISEGVNADLAISGYLLDLP